MKNALLLFLAYTHFLSAQIPPICFLPTSSYSYQIGTSFCADMVSEDFNSDGIPDIVTSDATGDKIFYMNGNGDGSFNASVSSPSFQVEAYPENLVAGDFNGDGKMDVVTVNSNSNSISLLLGTGTGSFLAQLTFSVGNFPRSLAKGDFNNDGKPDIVTSNYMAGTISLLLGTGSFLPGITLPATIGAQAITCGDYNNDGNQDLALCIWTYSFIKVYYGNGNSTFQSPVNYTMLNAFDNYPTTISSSDLNNDGYQDIIIHDSSGSVNVFAGSSSTAAATCTFVGSSNPGGGSNVIAVEDINGDGTADIVVPKTSMFLGTGTGAFLAPVNYTAYGGACSIVKDFNLDGKPDLGFIANTLFIVLNRPLIKTTTVPPFVCAGYTQTLGISGATTYSWSTGQTDSVIAVKPNTTTTYTGIAINPDGCKNKAVFTVSVIAHADSATMAFIKFISSGPDTVCAGDQINLCVTPGLDYAWSNGSNASCINPLIYQTTTFSVDVFAYRCPKYMSYSYYVEPCVGIKEWNEGRSKVLVYPNPTAGELQIDATEKVEIIVSNTIGEMLSSFFVDEGKHMLDLRNYASGVYTFVLKRGKQEIEAKKIIVLSH